jgi:hypothetical protein
VTGRARGKRNNGNGRRPRRRHPPEWANLSDEELLNLRLCDLDLRIEGSLKARINQLYRELKRANLRFRPHFWLSDEWFTPDGVPGVAIPFYLAHPRLARLERNQMLEVEGGTSSWFMRILRHETGHAFDNAYRLRRLRERQQLFGKSSQPYPKFYTPRPYSRSFVAHLDMWYAQSHPDEDFAETFAIWLTPRSMWRKRYAGWPALKKLELMNELMGEIARQKPLLTTCREVDSLPRLRKTLRRYYAEKRARYQVETPTFYDQHLQRLFTDTKRPGDMTAAQFLLRIRPDVRRVVAHWTGAYQYNIDQVLRDMIVRCRELRLRMSGPFARTKLDFTVLFTVQTMDYLHSGRHRVAL